LTVDKIIRAIRWWSYNPIYYS